MGILSCFGLVLAEFECRLNGSKSTRSVSSLFQSQSLPILSTALRCGSEPQWSSYRSLNEAAIDLDYSFATFRSSFRRLRLSSLRILDPFSATQILVCLTVMPKLDHDDRLQRGLCSNIYQDSFVTHCSFPFPLNDSVHSAVSPLLSFSSRSVNSSMVPVDVPPTSNNAGR